MRIWISTRLLGFGILVACSASTNAAGLAVTPFTFDDPEGNSSLASVTADGFTATLAPNVGARPRAISDFTPADLSQIGQSLRVAFDLTMNTTAPGNDRTRIRMALVDSIAGSEMIPMVHLGPNVGRDDFIRFRIDQDASLNHLGIGGQSRADPPSVLPPNGVPVSATGVSHSFDILLTRTGADTFSYSHNWTNTSGEGRAEYSFQSYNETNGDIVDVGGASSSQADDAWGNGGNLAQLDRFAILLERDAPFGAGVTGSYTLSNFTVTGVPVPEPTTGLLGLVALAGFALRRRRL